MSRIHYDQGRGELLQVAKVALPCLLCLRLPAGPGCVAAKQEVTLAEPEGEIYSYDCESIKMLRERVNEE